jgi:hypothetical protein
MLFPRGYIISPTVIHQATVPRCQCGLLRGIMLICDVCCRLAFGMISHTNEEPVIHSSHDVCHVTHWVHPVCRHIQWTHCVRTDTFAQYCIVLHASCLP